MLHWSEYCETTNVHIILTKAFEQYIIYRDNGLSLWASQLQIQGSLLTACQRCVVMWNFSLLFRYSKLHVLHNATICRLVAKPKADKIQSVGFCQPKNCGTAVGIVCMGLLALHIWHHLPFIWLFCSMQLGEWF